MYVQLTNSEPLAHFHLSNVDQIYGSLTKVTVFGQDILIVHSNEIAMELMIERGQIYSGRVSLPFACGEVGWDRLASFKNPGEEFRETRKIWHQTLEAKKAHKVRHLVPKRFPIHVGVRAFSSSPTFNQKFTVLLRDFIVTRASFESMFKRLSIYSQTLIRISPMTECLAVKLVRLFF
jgi:hypothetical protein